MKLLDLGPLVKYVVSFWFDMRAGCTLFPSRVLFKWVPLEAGLTFFSVSLFLWAGMLMVKQLQHEQKKGQEPAGPLSQTGSSPLSI